MNSCRLLDMSLAMAPAVPRAGHSSARNLQVSYTDDRGGYGSELDDEEAERREKAAKQELVPAFMESQEGYDDEVERVLGHRYILARPAAA